MSTTALSEGAEERLKRVFSPAQQSAARDILNESTRAYREAFGLTFAHPAVERFHFAALKVSRGDLAELQIAADPLKTDYRDLLVFAGFANDTEAHLHWMPPVRTRPCP